MPTAATHHRPAVVTRRSSSHSRSSSTSSLGKKGGTFGGGLGMTTGGPSSDAGSMAPPKLRKKSTSDGPSFHPTHHPSSNHVRLTSHRSETHIPRLGALQRTPSTTTIIDDSTGTSAPARHHSGLMDASVIKKSSSREAVPGDEEGWESNSDDGAAAGGHEIKKTTSSSSSKVVGGGRARSSSTSSRKVSNDGAHHPSGPTPVQRGAADRKAAGALAMFRIHSSSSDLLSTQTNGTSPKRQSFIVPSSSSNGPPLPLSRDQEEGGLPTPPVTSSPAPSSPDPDKEEEDKEIDPIPTPTSRRPTVRPAASSSSLSAQLLRHASDTNSNGLHHSVTSPSPASAANRAAAPSTVAASTLASIPQQKDLSSPPRKVYSDVHLANQGSDRSSSSTDLPSIHPRRPRTTSGHFDIHAPTPQINPPAQLLTTQADLHPISPVIPAADPHPSPPSSVDTATIVGADEPQQQHPEGDSYAFPTTQSPTSNNASADLPHHRQPSFPSIRGTRPPPLRTASSRSSLNSFTGASRNFAPRRLVSVTSNGPTTAPPQLSSDYASANPPVDPRSGWPVSRSPEVDTQSLRASTGGGGGGGTGDAMGHLRKASFSSLRGGTSPYGKTGSDLRDGRDRTTSMASLRSVESGGGGAYDTDSRSGGGRFGGAPSAMASLRSSTDIPSEFNDQPRQRSRLTSSSSSTSLAEGLKRSILGGLQGAAAQFLPTPLASSSSSNRNPPNSSPSYGQHPQRSASMFSSPAPPSSSAASSTGSISTLNPNFSSNNQQPTSNAGLVSHFQREQPSSLSNSEMNWNREDGRASLHPSPFLENHRALLKGMATATKGGGGGKAGGAKNGKGEVVGVGGAEATPMGLSVRRCLALR
ncbi:hypothetical protein BDY24DRAFT_394954 [Mrakia frigida]|uniref:uncharacterized protein n=1 Tax=Mrakia frigida TaxID=29902 RepID=UPI003FCBF767